MATAELNVIGNAYDTIYSCPPSGYVGGTTWAVLNSADDGSYAYWDTGNCVSGSYTTIANYSMAATPASGSITSVTVSMRVKFTSNDPYTTTRNLSRYYGYYVYTSDPWYSYYQITYMKPDGSTSPVGCISPTISINGTWQTVTWVLTTDPFGNPWTTDNLNSYTNNNGFGINIYLGNIVYSLRCRFYLSYVHATVNYTPPITIPVLGATTAASSITQTSATSGGNITSVGGENCSKRGVCYSTTTNPPTILDSKIEESGGSYSTGIFTESLTPLSSATKYYARAYAYNSAGYGYGITTDSFLTLPAAPTSFIPTPSDTHVDFTWANASGGAGTTINTMVRYKIGSYPSSYTDGTLGINWTASTSGAITSLTNGQLYYFSAFSRAVNGALTQYSITYAQTTATPTGVLANITLSAATAKESTTATLNGNIIITGSSNPTVTVYWGTVDHPGTSVGWDHSSVPTSPAQPQGVAAFYYNATGLETGTTIYFTAKATNSAGTSWPVASLSFLTKPSPVTVISASENISTAVTVTWTGVTGASTYHVWRDSSDLGHQTSPYSDTGAAAPVITAGLGNASDNTSAAHIALTCPSPPTIVNGTQYTYKVIAENVTGAATGESTDIGYRLKGTLGYQWWRSAADSNGSYSTLFSLGNSISYNDTNAPTDGTGRWYYCVVSAIGSISANTTSDRGRRITYFIKTLDILTIGLKTISKRLFKVNNIKNSISIGLALIRKENLSMLNGLYNVQQYDEEEYNQITLINPIQLFIPIIVVGYVRSLIINLSLLITNLLRDIQFTKNIANILSLISELTGKFIFIYERNFTNKIGLQTNFWLELAYILKAQLNFSVIFIRNVFQFNSNFINFIGIKALFKKHLVRELMSSLTTKVLSIQLGTGKSKMLSNLIGLISSSIFIQKTFNIPIIIIIELFNTFVRQSTFTNVFVASQKLFNTYTYRVTTAFFIAFTVYINLIAQFSKTIGKVFKTNFSLLNGVILLQKTFTRTISTFLNISDIFVKQSIFIRYLNTSQGLFSVFKVAFSFSTKINTYIGILSKFSKGTTILFETKLGLIAKFFGRWYKKVYKRSIKVLGR